MQKVILGEKREIMLWGFKVTLKDRRTGNKTDGYMVVTGNDSYDMGYATDKIKAAYSELGYAVTSCEYDDTRTFNFDAIEIFKHNRANRCATCQNYVNIDADADVEEPYCNLAADMAADGDVEKATELVTIFNGKGYGCKHYEEVPWCLQPVEDKPDTLEEYATALAAAQAELINR